MRDKILYSLAVLAGLLLARNLYVIFLELPDELNQGAIWRIFYFHLPSAITGFTLIFVAMLASAGFLVFKDYRYDSVAAASMEVAVPFIGAVLVTGSIWARIIWGIWWTWDHRLTSSLVCWLLCAGYLMLRRAVDEPGQRARLSAVLSIFAAADVVIVWKSIEWWRTQHPAPVLSIRNGGGMAPGMEAIAYWNTLAILMLATVLVMVRMRQETIQRELDSVRRYAHAM